MAAKHDNPYAHWLAACRPELHLADAGDMAPPEKLLQAIWAHQRLRRDELTTTDGRRVRVLHPGFWNREPGPDFQKALIQLDQEAPRCGDIEIDVLSGGWQQHAHAANPAYVGVVLHVIWGEELLPKTAPCLPLRPYLDAPLEELREWLRSEATEVPERVRGQCSAPLKSLNWSMVTRVLRQGAQTRLERKAAQLEALARQTGWEQALWEGIFSGLGYKKNVWPMRRLGELRRTIAPSGDGKTSNTVLQARLLGIAGLLPTTSEQLPSESKAYLRQLWDVWWREADQFHEFILPRSIWNFSGIRPANHPERRLALAAHWLARGDLPAGLEKWMNLSVDKPDLLSSLQILLKPEPDAFWEHHWTFRSPRSRKAHLMLGKHRLTDLAMNVILPWLWARAGRGGNRQLQETLENRYFQWPRGEENSVLRLASQRLFGTLAADQLKTAAEQQGMLQIVRDFCDHSNAMCEDCAFPALLRNLEPELDSA